MASCWEKADLLFEKPKIKTSMKISGIFPLTLKVKKL